jgi:hypothetical protein
LCEIEYAADEFVITKPYAEILNRRKLLFQRAAKSRMHLFQTMVTTHGVKKNDAYIASVDSEVTMEALF